MEESSGCLMLVTESSINHQVLDVLEFLFLFLFQPNLYFTADFWNCHLGYLGTWVLVALPEKCEAAYLLTVSVFGS